ncbi:GTPase-activating protein RGA2 [Kluyveromyces lactis]|uniref:KLLA0E02597p n=1 Tax=Kluyveromyces lactis (strain ATCC 8585 / CBS 2359 / DSM 70799 / NBRC 1267 / NRRL Y-1140 / WM37) TaxID=284590 RepID=Q6CPS6_KLULA|nr:uncharacterized protein KLLA0_E02597g [Kluyveromyces lactis]CAG99150.1 KLLA0E02597p [Kluyveromyces lactis]|eukprot:XP_454063.1 uncharacterized protein KLLA0_E02597g [Kluyveromyces lactis]
MSASPKGAAETSVCVRCTNHITMGHAYELGGNRWHTHCFSCYKCDKPLSCDSDFLVLGTSDLICFECSDSCKNCGKKIDDLAIILASSNEAYCSECFKCCKCGEKINDLRYAKTKKGLFCITCHERLLARKKYHEEKKRRLKKQLPIVPSPKLPDSSSSLDPQKMEFSSVETANNSNLNSSLDPGLELTPESNPYSVVSSIAPDRSSSRPATAELLQHNHQHADNNYSEDVINQLNQSPSPPPQKSITAPIDFSKKDAIVKSSSNSVIAQFLDDEYHDDDGNVSISTQHKDSQLDKILQNTLDNSEEDTLQISSTFNSSDNLPSSLRQNSDSSVMITRADLEQQLNDGPDSSINKTPLHSSVKSPSHGLKSPRSPELHRHAIVYATESQEDIISEQYSTSITAALNTPKARNNSIEEDSHFRTPKSDTESKPTGLGISTPKSKQKFKLSSSLAIISPRTEAVKHSNTIGIPYDSTEERPPSSTNTENASTINHSAPDHHRRTSSGAKNITRSLSFRSKNLISNLRNKTRSANSPGRSSEKDFDTHSGWGVVSTHPAIDESSSSQTTQVPRRRVSGRGQSDSTIYSHIPTDSAQQPNHIRSQSGSNKVAMFRTPPLGSANTTVHSHNKSLSIDPNNQSTIREDEKSDDDRVFTPVAKDFFEKDVKSISLQLRKLNMEVKELQLTKAQLTADIEKLKITKETLTSETEALRIEKRDLKLTTTSQESLTDDAYEVDFNGSNNALSPTRNQLPSTSNSSIAKPRFWKLFGSGNTNVRQVNPNSSKSIEISAPMLQNPNEFDDLKLFPIPYSASNDSVPRNSLSSSSSDGQTLYGSSLVARCAYERRDVPLIITTCINYIESDPEYMMAEGIYRKSGSQVIIEQYEKMFAEEEKVDFGKQNTDVHAVTSIFKRYLRKLPNPVFGYQCYESLINLIRENNLLIELPLNNSLKQPDLFTNILVKLSDILKTLPIQHLVVLKLLCNHLELIMRYQEDNLMNLHNLALVFAPGLIKDYSGEKDIVDMKERNYLIGLVLQNYREIFKVLQQKIDA